MIDDDNYEALVGSISIAWNRLEREMDRLLFVFLREEADVFDRLLASIGNVTKGDLLLFLCKKRARNKPLQRILPRRGAPIQVDLGSLSDTDQLLEAFKRVVLRIASPVLRTSVIRCVTSTSGLD